MQFNPDPNKQTNEVMFSRKSKVHQKSKLDFNILVDNKIKNCYKIIGLIKRLPVSVPKEALLTIYKSFIRPHVDYGDILYDKPENQNFQNKFKKVQYKVCLAITRAIQGTSRQKNYDELGLHTLIEKRWRSKLIFFVK